MSYDPAKNVGVLIVLGIQVFLCAAVLFRSELPFVNKDLSFLKDYTFISSAVGLALCLSAGAIIDAVAAGLDACLPPAWSLQSKASASLRLNHDTVHKSLEDADTPQKLLRGTALTLFVLAAGLAREMLWPHAGTSFCIGCLATYGWWRRRSAYIRIREEIYNLVAADGD